MIVRLSSNKLVWLLALVVYLWKYLLFNSLLAFGVYILFEYYSYTGIGLKGAIPLGVLGTALSIFLSFRNNSAYDRWWEARKIWGGLVNQSRTFAIQVLTYVSQSVASSNEGIKNCQHRLIYRHLAYIHALRLALRGQKATYRNILSPYLTPEELELALTKANVPTYLNYLQSKDLHQIYQSAGIEDFRLYELMHSLEAFFDLQGKAERIKATPFPMYYDFFIRVFLLIFVSFLPMTLIGLLNEISQATAMNVNWLVVPLSVIVTFMFIVIEKAGSFTETPFENKNEDIPLTALCRTIEVDLKEMIDDPNLPDPITIKKILIDAEVLM